MPQYLILKLEGGVPREIAAVVDSEDEPDKAIKQGFTGDGRYAILDWDERVEAELGLGPVKATGVEDRATRAELVAAPEAKAGE